MTPYAHTQTRTIYTHEYAEAFATASGYQTQLLHTGGGCMVVSVDLTQDGRWLGATLWLTESEIMINDNDEPTGITVGFYDMADDDDEGTCVDVWTGSVVADKPQYDHLTDAAWLADHITAILRRLDVRYIG